MTENTTKQVAILDLYMPGDERAKNFLRDYPLGLLSGIAAMRTYLEEELKGVTFKLRLINMPEFLESEEFNNLLEVRLKKSLQHPASMIVSGNSRYSSKLLELQAGIQAELLSLGQLTQGPAHGVIGLQLGLPSKSQYASFAFRMFPSFRQEIIRFLDAIHRFKPNVVVSLRNDYPAAGEFVKLLRKRVYRRSDLPDIWINIPIPDIRNEGIEAIDQQKSIMVIYAGFDEDFANCQQWVNDNFRSHKVSWLFGLHMANRYLNSSDFAAELNCDFEIMLPKEGYVKKDSALLSADKESRSRIELEIEKLGAAGDDWELDKVGQKPLDWVGKYAYDLGQAFVLAVRQKRRAHPGENSLVLTKRDLLEIQPFRGLTGSIRIDDKGDLVTGIVALRGKYLKHEEGKQERQPARHEISLPELPQTAGISNTFTSKDFHRRDTQQIKRKIKRFIQSELFRLGDFCCFLDVTCYDLSDEYERYSVCAGPPRNLVKYQEIVRRFQSPDGKERPVKIGNHPVFRAGLPILSWEGEPAQLEQELARVAGPSKPDDQSRCLPVWRYPQNKEELSKLQEFIQQGLGGDWVLTVNQAQRWEIENSRPNDEPKSGQKLKVTVTEAIELEKKETSFFAPSDVPSFDDTVNDFLVLLREKAAEFSTLKGYPLRQLVLVPITLYRTDPDVVYHPIAYLVMGIGWSDGTASPENMRGDPLEKVERWLNRTIATLRAFLLATFTTNGLSRVLREENYYHFYNQFPLELSNVASLLEQTDGETRLPEAASNVERAKDSLMSIQFALTRYRATYCRSDFQSSYDIIGYPDSLDTELNKNTLERIYRVLVEPFVWERLEHYEKEWNFQRKQYLETRARLGYLEFRKQLGFPDLECPSEPVRLPPRTGGALFICLVLALRQAAFHCLVARLYRYNKNAHSKSNKLTIRLFAGDGRWVISILNEGLINGSEVKLATWQTKLEYRSEPLSEVYPRGATHDCQDYLASELKLFVRAGFSWIVAQDECGRFSFPSSFKHAL